MSKQFWVDVSVTERKTGNPKSIQRGPFDTFTLAQITAQAVDPGPCVVENATVFCNGVEVIGYRSRQGGWSWDPAPASWVA